MQNRELKRWAVISSYGGIDCDVEKYIWAQEYCTAKFIAQKLGLYHGFDDHDNFIEEPGDPHNKRIPAEPGPNDYVVKPEHERRIQEFLRKFETNCERDFYDLDRAIDEVNINLDYDATFAKNLASRIKSDYSELVQNPELFKVFLDSLQA